MRSLRKCKRCKKWHSGKANVCDKCIKNSIDEIIRIVTKKHGARKAKI